MLSTHNITSYKLCNNATAKVKKDFQRCKRFNDFRTHTHIRCARARVIIRTFSLSTMTAKLTSAKKPVKAKLRVSSGSTRTGKRTVSSDTAFTGISATFFVADTVERMKIFSNAPYVLLNIKPYD